MKIWALHGFLGQASDFSELQKKCLEQNANLQWQSIDYMHSRELSPQSTLEEWGEHFCKLVEKANQLAPTENVLLGYSQGGRLALQALKKKTGLWKKAILLSTNPGLPISERPARLRSDQEWADKFLNQSFSKTLAQWNAQPVFQGSVHEPERNETDFNRHQLADCLTRWSLAQQEDFHLYLKQSSVPILYISGEKDSKYVQIGKSLAAANPKIQHRQISEAGHRVFMDRPDQVAVEIIRFLGS